MVDTKKFSEFDSGGDLENADTTVGLKSGTNVRFNNPWVFLPEGTTAERPPFSGDIIGRLRFNTDNEQYEFINAAGTWVIIEDSTDPSDILALLASHDAGKGASLIGLQDQGAITNQTVQDLANSTLIAQVDDGTLVNGQFLGQLATGLLSSTTTTGVVASRTLTGTANQVNVSNGDGSGNPTLSVSSTLDLPGTVTVQSSTVIDEIIDDDTMATATDSNLSTSEAIKNYVDTVAEGLIVVAAARAATTGALTVTYDNGVSGVGATLTNAGAQAAFALDGVTLNVGDRVLIKDQASTFQNGVYSVTDAGSGATNWVLTRTTDFDQPVNIVPGDLVPILEGTTLALTSWLQTETVTTVGTDPIVFIQWSISVNDVMTLSTNQTATGEKTFDANVFVDLKIAKKLDDTNYHEFNADAQDFATGGSSRMDIDNTGFRLGGADSRVTSILDEDDMVSDSATALATQQSIKAYVDNSLALGTSFVSRGRLTLTTGVPVTTSDVTAATTLYFTPYVGNVIDLYDGSSTWDRVTFSEISIAVPASTSQMYDIFVYNNAGTATLELLAWTNDTTRATALTTQDGVLVLTGTTTRRYVGSFRTTTVSGETEDSAVKRYLWNYYNRVQKKLYVTDATATWTYSTATIRQANGNSANQVEIVTGVSEDCFDVSLISSASNGVANANWNTGIGLDTTTTYTAGQLRCTVGSLSGDSQQKNTSATFKQYSGIGYHYIAWLEFSDGNGTVTFTGSSAGSGLSGTFKC